MSTMLVCHGSLSCSYMAFVPFHCLLLLDIFAQFLSFYLKYTNIYYIQCYLTDLQLIRLFFCSTTNYMLFVQCKEKMFYKKFPLTSTHAMLIKCLINICVLFSVYSQTCVFCDDLRILCLYQLLIIRISCSVDIAVHYYL